MKMIEKEFVWGNLHYALDGLDRFSVVSVFPKLPYEYTPKELELYKINVQELTYDRNEPGRDNRGNLGNKEVYFEVHCRTREELFDVHNHLLHNGFERIQIFYDDPCAENTKHVIRKEFEKRYYFDMKEIQMHLAGFPTVPDLMMSNEEAEILAVPDPSGWCDPFSTLQIRVHERDIEKFIFAIKKLKHDGYKNMWLYPGREVQNAVRYNNEVLIA